MEHSPPDRSQQPENATIDYALVDELRAAHREESPQEPLAAERLNDLADSLIGTAREPRLQAGGEVVFANGETYRIETIDFSARGIVLHNTTDPTEGYDLSFADFVDYLL